MQQKLMDAEKKKLKKMPEVGKNSHTHGSAGFMVR